MSKLCRNKLNEGGFMESELFKNSALVKAEPHWISELYQWADENNIPELEYYEDLWEEDNRELIDYGFWAGLPRDRDVLLNLEELNLSWHNCLEIPSQIRHLTKLKNLKFAKKHDGLQPCFHEVANGPNKITQIPGWISELVNLEVLDLSGNGIDIVPKSIGHLHNLKKLYLHDNMIMFVDAELASLCKLEVLWIHLNMFSVLDNCIDNLKGLVNCDVDWEQQNKISLFIDCIYQNDFQDWTDKKHLSFDTEGLEALNHGLVQLTGLTGSNDTEILWNEWNRLNNLKYQLKNLKNLRELYCDGLEYPSGPIKLCPEGLIMESETV